MNININDKLFYFGAGCGIGLVLGALFAPRSGQETRRNLSGKVDELTQKVQDRIHTSGIGEAASQTWQNAVQTGKNVASIGRQRIHESIAAGKRRMMESVEDEDLLER
jgi:gas vesicle protein